MKYKNTKRNYLLKIIHGQKVERYETKSLRRFLNHTRTINWKDSPCRVYLRVSYGKKEDVFGKQATFYNDGTYENKEDFNLALEAFLEDE